MREFLIGVVTLGAGIFTASAFGKLRTRTAFRAYAAGIRPIVLVIGRRLPAPMKRAVPMALAAAEAAAACALAGAACLLIAGPASGYVVAEAALGAAVALAALLTCGVAVTIRRGIPASCRCFGAGAARPLSMAHVVRNTILLVVLAAGIAGDALAGGRHGRLAPAEAALAVLSGLTGTLLLASWDDLASLLAAGPSGHTRGGTRGDAGGDRAAR